MRVKFIYGSGNLSTIIMAIKIHNKSDGGFMKPSKNFLSVCKPPKITAFSTLSKLVTNLLFQHEVKNSLS